jgi:hypothetical protein
MYSHVDFPSLMCSHKETALLQRVLSASVTVDQQVVSSIGKGIVVFVAMAPGDTEKEAESLASKLLKLKLWEDESGGRVRCPPSSEIPFSLTPESGSGSKVSRTSAAKSSAVRGCHISPVMPILTPTHSIPIHSARLHQEGQQARLPRSPRR